MNVPRYGLRSGGRLLMASTVAMSGEASRFGVVPAGCVLSHAWGGSERECRVLPKWGWFESRKPRSMPSDGLAVLEPVSQRGLPAISSLS